MHFNIKRIYIPDPCLFYQQAADDVTLQKFHCSSSDEADRKISSSWKSAMWVHWWIWTLPVPEWTVMNLKINL